MDFSDFIQRSNRCSSREQLIKLFETTLSELGVDGFVYSLIRGSFAATNKILHGVARSYPEDWMKHYTANNYIQHDPTYRHVIKQKGLITWKSLQETQPLSVKEKLVMNEAEDAGLKNGISLSLHGPYGELMGFGFASRVSHSGLNKDELSILYAMANQFHLVYASFDETSNVLPSMVLSDRQKEVLQWTAAGKSYGDIADIMNLSEDTVKHHLKQTYKKLNCNDKMLAVLQALKLGLITV